MKLEQRCGAMQGGKIRAVSSQSGTYSAPGENYPRGTTQLPGGYADSRYRWRRAHGCRRGHRTRKSRHACLSAATRSMAPYTFMPVISPSRNLCIAVMLLVLLAIRSTRAFAHFTMLAASIQIVDAAFDCVEGRWASSSQEFSSLAFPPFSRRLNSAATHFGKQKAWS